MTPRGAGRSAGPGGTAGSMLAALPRQAATWLVAVSVLGGGMLAFCLAQLPSTLGADQQSSSALLLLPFLLGAAIAFGIRPIRLGPSQKIHMGAAPLFCAALLYAPALAGVVAYLSALTHNLWLRRRPWNAVFNAAQHLVTAAGAGLVYHAALSVAPDPTGPLVALVAAGCAYFLVSTLLSATMAALAQHQAWRGVIVATWRMVWAHYLTLLTFGWLAALVASSAAWSLPFLIVPVAVAYRLDRTLGDLLETRRTLSATLQRQRQFVGDVAHELGAPLTSVAGNAAVLLTDPTLPPAVKEPVEDIFAEATRTAKLLQDLLLLSTVEEGTPLPSAPVPLRAVAEQALRLCRTQAAARGVTLALDAPVDGWTTGSRELLEQLVFNLIENGVKHSVSGGTVAVTVAGDNGRPTLSVRDNGVGIPPDELSRIFQRRYRADKAESRALGGAGLGLAIARRIAEAHGAQLVAESAPGVGSCFTLSFPTATV